MKVRRKPARGDVDSGVVFRFMGGSTGEEELEFQGVFQPIQGLLDFGIAVGLLGGWHKFEAQSQEGFQIGRGLDMCSEIVKG